MPGAARGRARTRSSTSARATRARSRYYRDVLRRDRARLPAADAQARDLGDAGGAPGRARLRPGDRRGPGLRRGGVLSRARAPGRRSARRPRRRAARGRVQGHRGRPARPRALARRRGGALPPAPRVVLAVPGRRARRSASTDEYHDRLPPERMPFAYRASDVFVGASRVGGGIRPAVARGPRLRPAGAALRRAGPARDRRRARPRTSATGTPRASPTRCPALLDPRGARAGARGGPGGRGARFDAARRGRAARARVPRGAGDGARDARASPRSSSTTAAPREAAACVASLREAFARERIEGEIVLVDCASGPEEVRALARLRRRHRGLSPGEPRLLGRRERGARARARRRG